MNQQGKVTLLLFLFSICATAALIRWITLEADPAENHPPTELFSVVQDQLEALRSANHPTAYSHASTTFQQHWSLEQFISMAHTDYRRVLRAESVEYGPWQRRGNHASIQVFFVHSDGSVLPCIYTLVREKKRWKIDQAQWLKGWPTGQRMRGIRS